MVCAYDEPCTLAALCVFNPHHKVGGKAHHPFSQIEKLRVSKI